VRWNSVRHKEEKVIRWLPLTGGVKHSDLHGQLLSQSLSVLVADVVTCKPVLNLLDETCRDLWAVGKSQGEVVEAVHGFEQFSDIFPRAAGVSGLDTGPASTM
jgi:hypothetical protein